MHSNAVMPAPGEMLEVSVPEVGWVPARVTRLNKQRLCVQFKPDEATRHRLIKLIFCQAPHNIAVKAHPLRAFAQLLRMAGVSLPPPR
jgi:cellulose synthase (UDP-forming)